MFSSTEHLRYIDKLPVSELDKYIIIDHIDKGGFGAVYKAHLRGLEGAGLFAIKTAIIERHKGRITNYDRSEIHALTLLKDEDNIVKLVDLVQSRSIFGIVLEFCKCDLRTVIGKLSIPISDPEKKNILRQLVTGMNAMHSKKIMHRDIKPANILLSSNGVVKISDFNLSMQWGLHSPEERPYTNEIATLWYKAPELLLGDTMYSETIDVWSMGCVATELWIRKVLFRGNNMNEQMRRISMKCGFLTDQVWPRASTLSRYNEMHRLYGHYQQTTLSQYLMLQTGNTDATILIGSMLKTNPTKRIDAQRAYTHWFWKSWPVPSTDLKSILERV